MSLSNKHISKTQQKKKKKNLHGSETTKLEVRITSLLNLSPHSVLPQSMTFAIFYLFAIHNPWTSSQLTTLGLFLYDPGDANPSSSSLWAFAYAYGQVPLVLPSIMWFCFNKFILLNLPKKITKCYHLCTVNIYIYIFFVDEWMYYEKVKR